MQIPYYEPSYGWVIPWSRLGKFLRLRWIWAHQCWLCGRWVTWLHPRCRKFSRDGQYFPCGSGTHATEWAEGCWWCWCEK